MCKPVQIGDVQKTAERTIPHFKQGKKLYFNRSELDDWLTAQKNQPMLKLRKKLMNTSGEKVGLNFSCFP